MFNNTYLASKEVPYASKYPPATFLLSCPYSLYPSVKSTNGLADNVNPLTPVYVNLALAYSLCKPVTSLIHPDLLKSSK